MSETQTKCPSCWAYFPEGYPHKCDGLMLGLVKIHTDKRIEALEAATRQKTDEVEGLQKQLEESRKNEMACLILLSKIRFAVGDNGKRMQDELVEFCRELAAKATAHDVGGAWGPVPGPDTKPAGSRGSE